MSLARAPASKRRPCGWLTTRSRPLCTKCVGAVKHPQHQSVRIKEVKRMSAKRSTAIILLLGSLLALAHGSSFSASFSSNGFAYLPYITTMPPAPELELTHWEDEDGYRRYWLSVVNWASFPSEMFESAPDLPPCGLSTSASRTWVEIYTVTGARIYGFCGFHNPEDMTRIWFSVEEGVTPPAAIYIVLNDRRMGILYRSNDVAIAP